MKNYVIVFALLAFALAGCDNGGYEIVCGPQGDLYKHPSGYTGTAEGLDNKKQYCTNKPDGTIQIRFRNVDYED